MWLALALRAQRIISRRKKTKGNYRPLVPLHQKMNTNRLTQTVALKSARVNNL